MGNRIEAKWYAPLEPYFKGKKDYMKLKKFAAIEAVLHLLLLDDPDADPSKACNLFAQYQRIGTTECTSEEHILQQVRLNYDIGIFRSKKNWLDALKEYQDSKYDAYRAFSFEKTKDKNSFSKAKGEYPHPYEARKQEWEKFFSEEGKKTWSPSYAKSGKYYYNYLNSEIGQSEKVCIEFNKDIELTDSPVVSQKGERGAICITLDELLDAAKEMAEIKPGDPCYKILKTNVLKQISSGSVKKSTELKIQGVVNIVGMVGSGKSTLMKVLAFWCHKNGYRMTLVVDTIAEVMNLQKYLSGFGIKSSPLIGRSERLKYINQISQPEKTCLPKEFSKYLTPLCLVDGMDTQHEAALTFGKEPCYSLKKGEISYLCPYFHQCGATAMKRECYTSSVVITTVAGFATSTVGANHETFFETVMSSFGLVVFDESDRVQKTLDSLLMPETIFGSYIRESADEAKNYRQTSSKERNENLLNRKFNEKLSICPTIESCIVNSLHEDLGKWKLIENGSIFSAFMLLEDLYQKESPYQISHTVYQALYSLIDIHVSDNIAQSTLFDALENSCKDSTDDRDFIRKYSKWTEEMGESFPRPKILTDINIQDSRIKLILRLIYFDHYIRELNSAYEMSHETSYGQSELFGFLRVRFKKLQYFLPSALCGNLFGLKKTDDEDINLFRQYAFGRSLMKDLPYLCTDSQGNPTGPHAVLLSGSSWAEGSYEYHINRPVNYILEADAEKRAFLEKTRFIESGFTERVSGAPEDQRMARLRSVTERAALLIIKEYKRKAGKILLVVNSYAEAEEVQRTLTTALHRENCHAKVCRMVTDAVNSENIEGTVRRGEVSRFAEMDEEILIAPAMAIERGHNIVDETGHSALCAVFFMVRPMSVPNDIQQKAGKLNGYIEAHCHKSPEESIVAYNTRIRHMATQKWIMMSQSKSFGLAELDSEEKKDVIATLFIIILQIFGRLARVTDVTKPEPHVYFIDGAFRGVDGKKESFDCLSELGRYLDTLMTGKDSAEIAKTLYDPFYKAYRRDITYEKEPNNLSAGI